MGGVAAKGIETMRAKIGLSSVAALVLAGCAVTSNPERAYDTVQPTTRVIRNVTSFTPALRCMDDLFQTYNVTGLYITTNGIPDATAKVNVGTTDMLITAIGQMSRRSGAFTYVDFDVSQQNIELLAGLGNPNFENFEVPDFYIRGAITQLDQGVISETVGGGISLPGFEVGAQKDLIVSIVAVDMNIGRTLTRQIVPGLHSNNQVAVARRGIGGDAGASIGKAGISFNINLGRSEGIHQATRALIELSVIELLGKLAQVPYWRCLQIEQTNPEMMDEAQDWFSAMSETERVVFAQRALKRLGTYTGPVSGVLDASTRSVVAEYQAKNDLLPSGQIDFALYQSFFRQDLAVGRRAKTELPAEPLPPSPLLSVKVAALRDGAGPFKVGESLNLSVTTTQASFVYCYYRDDKGDVSRVFPNRFQPDPFLLANIPMNIPGETASFKIVLQVPNVSEEIACVASEKEVGRELPDAFKLVDLKPLPANSMDDLLAMFRDRDDRLAVSRLDIPVE